MKKSRASEKPNDNSPFIWQDSKIDFDLHIREYEWTAKQREIIDTALDKKCVMSMIDGVWGSGKTLVAVYTCLKLLLQKKISHILYVRNAVDSGVSLGYRPGDEASKMEPYVFPFVQKLQELLPKGEIDRLLKEERVICKPVSYLRGTTFNCYGIIIDEAGCMTKPDLLLTLSRVGNYSRVFCIGDSFQTDVKNSGFESLFNIFSDQESKDNGVFTYSLREEMDVMRSPFLRFIMRKIQGPLKL